MPRPYECARRAWHSERHRPIRGSLVQEMLRLANEAHNPATRMNKEWLEKLPVVVLKAEEVMYSKANSEAEYMDLKTLWHRANEAIDTIIRRDEAPETDGDLLQPCIEAALNLGCIPRSASRSQRNINPGCYLSSFKEGAQNLVVSAHIFPMMPVPMPQSGTRQSSLSPLEPRHSALMAGNKSSHFSSEASFKPKDSVSPSNCGIAVDSSLNLNKDRRMSDSFGTYSSPSISHVYPLHYGNESPCATPELSVMKPQESVGNMMLGVPCKDEMVLLHDFIGNDAVKSIPKASSIHMESSEDPPDRKCDLSLRLGLFSPASLDAEGAWTHEDDDENLCNRSKYSN